MTSHQPLHLVSLAMFVATMLVGLVGCPKPPPPPPEVVDQGPQYDGPAPIISSVRPGSGKEGEIVDLTVEGQYFRQGAVVYVGRKRASNVSLLDGGTLRCTAPGGIAAGVYDVRVVNTDTTEDTLARAFTVEQAYDCALSRVTFDYDRSELTRGAQQSLESNAECIQKKGFRTVRVEGHADERGSTEYNLALGQRRADSVKKYLVNLGVDASVLRTITYGEEKPLKTGSGEINWAENRRAELVAE